MRSVVHWRQQPLLHHRRCFFFKCFFFFLVKKSYKIVLLILLCCIFLWKALQPFHAWYLLYLEAILNYSSWSTSGRTPEALPTQHNNYCTSEELNCTISIILRYGITISEWRREEEMHQLMFTGKEKEKKFNQKRWLLLSRFFLYILSVLTI